MDKKKIAWAVVAICAMVTSAFSVVMVVGQGIVYGDLVGLKSYHHELEIAALWARIWMVLGGGLQLVACVATSLYLRRKQAFKALRIWMVGMIAVLISVLGTVVITWTIFSIARLVILFH